MRNANTNRNQLETYILTKRCSIQLNLNLLNFSECDFIRSRMREQREKKEYPKKNTFILIVCHFLVHLHQLSALLRFLLASHLRYDSFFFHLRPGNSLSIRIEKVSMFCLTQRKTLFLRIISFFIWWWCRQHVVCLGYTAAKKGRMSRARTKSIWWEMDVAIFLSNITDADVLFFSCLRMNKHWKWK